MALLRHSYRFFTPMVLLPLAVCRLAAQTGSGNPAVPPQAGTDGLAMLVMAMVPFLLVGVVLAIVLRAHTKRRQANAERLLLNDPARWN